MWYARGGDCASASALAAHSQTRERLCAGEPGIYRRNIDSRGRARLSRAICQRHRPKKEIERYRERERERELSCSLPVYIIDSVGVRLSFVSRPPRLDNICAYA